VFDVDELVKVLEGENGIDVRVIDVPPEIRFVDHMVIVSGKSLRHMRAMAATIEYLVSQLHCFMLQ
jgi:ribosomal silencing factor RsfS